MTQTTKQTAKLALEDVGSMIAKAQAEISNLLDLLHASRNLRLTNGYDVLPGKKHDDIVGFLDKAIERQDRWIQECEERYGKETAQYFKKKRTDLRQRECV